MYIIVEGGTIGKHINMAYCKKKIYKIWEIVCIVFFIYYLLALTSKLFYCLKFGAGCGENIEVKFHWINSYTIGQWQ